MSRAAEAPDRFESSGFCVLRTPLLPFDALLAWAQGLPGAARAPALPGDRPALRRALADCFEIPEVREALTLASPSLAEALERPGTARYRDAEDALVRYLARMAGRATPFGWMAGCSVGEVGDDSRLDLPPRSQYRRRTRLDGGYLSALCAGYLRRPEVRAAMIFRPDPGLYAVGAELRCTSARRPDQHSFRTAAIERSPWVDAVLDRARGGARPPELVAALVEAGRVAEEDAAAFVDQMIDSRVLVSDLEPPVTGPDPEASVIAELRRSPASVAAADAIERARARLAALDASGAAPPGGYRAALEELRALRAEAGEEGAPAPLLMADLIKPAPGLRLHRRVVDEALRGALLLQRIQPARVDHPDLAWFRERFVRRYEAREVPLVEALDPESGIGFAPPRAGSAALDDLGALPAPRQAASWEPRHAVLLEALRRAWAGGGVELSLRPEEIDALTAKGGRAAPLPDAFAALVSIASPSTDAIAEGRFRLVLHSVHGPSGARLLGRLCHQADAGLTALVEEHLRQEERSRPDAVFAELLVVPKQRHRNIVGRPVLRAYEIPFACRSGAPPERQLPISDLLVSVVDGRITLRSARLGREVLPRITSAIHWAHPEGHGVHRLLGALQQQGAAGHLAFDWGPLEDAAFLPRVTVGRLVLSLARWLVPGEALGAARAAGEAERFQAVQRLRGELGWPRFVAAEQGESALPIDLDNALCVDALLRLARGQVAVRITEVFPGPDELCVRGPEGRFAHEALLPFVRAGSPQAAPRRALPAPLPARPRADRSRAPGSDWLYAKLYTGAATADAILCDVLGPLLRDAQRAGAVDCWFFVRYADPDRHLRVRLHGPARRLAAEVLPALSRLARALLEDARISRLQLDTYEREVERYGGPEGVRVAERLFHADSEAVLAFLLAARGAGPIAPTRFAVTSIDRLLAALGLGLAEKRALVGARRDAFARELGVTVAQRRELSSRFRAERDALAETLTAGRAKTLPEAWGRALDARDRRVAAAARRLRALSGAGRLSLPLAEIAESYVHMHVNRLFRASQRAHEFVVLDLLHRLYSAEAAR